MLNKITPKNKLSYDEIMELYYKAVHHCCVMGLGVECSTINKVMHSLNNKR
ncbi:hypothetical protein S140_233 [Shewanella sp. phage 1/40]|uniref:hypothetical protein n=1 Tax=Shewanella sp. phage 1/40 TaxID=1458860 RepID=UPI0004F682DB|nr:hypothetical protein S140_233 [Shewanella sp. phage 1/40]AHK11640.1 hypothetical protein S140_233 [Shewanella sp. phage 1/40]